jgi:hypothetical protein
MEKRHMSTITKLANKHGLKMVDAKQDLMITLRENDIHDGKVKSPQHCAFACAVTRQVAHVADAYFFRSTAWLRKTDDTLERYTLPNSVRQEITAFDRGGKMMPGPFVLKAPVGSNKRGAAAKRRAANGSKSRPSKLPHPRLFTDFSGKRQPVIPQ